MSKKIDLPQETSYLSRSREASFLLRVSPGKECDIQGKIEHIGSGQYQNFQSYGQLIQLICLTLEETGSPQSDCMLRRWS